MPTRAPTGGSPTFSSVALRKPEAEARYSRRTVPCSNRQRTLARQCDGAASSVMSINRAPLASFHQPSRDPKRRASFRVSCKELSAGERAPRERASRSRFAPLVAARLCNFRNIGLINQQSEVGMLAAQISSPIGIEIALHLRGGGELRQDESRVLPA